MTTAAKPPTEAVPPEPAPEETIEIPGPEETGTVCEVCGRRGRAEGHH